MTSSKNEKKFTHSFFVELYLEPFIGIRKNTSKHYYWQMDILHEFDCFTIFKKNVLKNYFWEIQKSVTYKLFQFWMHILCTNLRDVITLWTCAPSKWMTFFVDDYQRLQSTPNMIECLLPIRLRTWHSTLYYVTIRRWITNGNLLL